MVVSTTVGDTPDRVVAWGLRLKASAHPQESQGQTTRPLVQEQLEMQNQNPVPTECALLSRHHKSGLSGT